MTNLFWNTVDPKLVAFGRSYLMGEDPNHAVKVDIYYTDPFIQEPLIADDIRMATAEEIAAMKVNVIQRGGRKKDFWDIHELLEHNTLGQMIDLHRERYPHDHDEQVIRKKFTDFTRADDDLDPICLRGKYWEIIKLDILELLS